MKTCVRILADDDAPGCVLARETAVQAEDVPRWGQTGIFVIEIGGMAVQIEMNGLFGIGSWWGFWAGHRRPGGGLRQAFSERTTKLSRVDVTESLDSAVCAAIVLPGKSGTTSGAGPHVKRLISCWWLRSVGHKT